MILNRLIALSFSSGAGDVMPNKIIHRHSVMVMEKE